MTTTPPTITGVHHVTAFAGDPTENVAFYTGVLGLRLVKRTVNFDDPSTWHLYYADRTGTPGTILTHFPDPRMKPNVSGVPEIRETILAVPTGSLDAWRAHLDSYSVVHETARVMGESRLRFDDPHRQRLALVEREGVPAGALPVDAAMIHVSDAEATAAFLRTALGFEEGPSDDGRRRLSLPGVPIGQVELVADPDTTIAKLGAGGVHHVAWRVPDGDAQLEVAARVRTNGAGVTEVKDRKYFKSIYFRIPGGVVFEIATDGPGFTFDEREDTLGESLTLPHEYEGRRTEIERALPAIEPSATRGAT